MATWDTVLTFAPELSSVTDTDVQDAYLGLAATYVDSVTLGTKYTMAHALATAHLLTMQKTAAGGGPVSSMAVGGVSVSFAVNAMTAEGLKRTGYGQQVLTLIRRAGKVPGVIWDAS